MRSWPNGRRIKSKQFMVEGVSLSLSLYPNGVKGYSHHTAVLLISDVHSTPVYVDFKIQIGEKVLDEKGMIKPGYGIGAPQWLPHKTLSLHKSEVITVKLTIQEVTLVGTYCYTNNDFKNTLDILSNKKLGDLGWIEYRDLKKGSEAFNEIHNGTCVAPKIILIP